MGEALHIQQYLLSKATNADEKADIAALHARAPPLNTTPATHRGMLLQDCTRLLCNQLRALPSDKRSIEELRQAGEYVDLAELWLQIEGGKRLRRRNGRRAAECASGQLGNKVRRLPS